MKQSAPVFVMLILVCAALIGLISCDKDCPTCPQRELGSDYDLYISGADAHAVYVYSTRRKDICDSIPLADSLHIGAIAVSGDGRHLLVAAAPKSNSSASSLTVIDVKTGDTVLVYNDLITNVAEARIEVSNTGKYIAVYDGNNVHFLDGTTFAVLFSDTLDVYCGRFTLDDSRFYAVWRETGFVVYDMVSQMLSGQYSYGVGNLQPPSLYGIQPRPDESTFYLMAAYESVDAEYVITTYRPGHNDLVFGQRIGRPLGELQISPDSTIVMASNPGDVVGGRPGNGYLIVYDYGYTKPAKIYVSRAYFPTDCGLWYMLAGDFAFTPDSRYAVVADERGQGFALLDVPTLRYVDVVYLPSANSRFNLVACPKTPDTYSRPMDTHWPQRGDK